MGELPKPASAPTEAVFLSYASQDVEAAQRICGALRSAGIEVWFDRSELRGGDAWDRQIRKQIHDCRLFIAVISAQTESRDEGYFRREWKMAVERTADLAADVPFLLPVAIDGTYEGTARVPDEFLRVQWLRLPAGDATSAFVERVLRLMAPRVRERSEPIRAPQSPRRARNRGRRVLYGAIIAVAAVLVVGYCALRWADRAGSVAPGAPSIAVLPLANESGQPSEQYFSDGISEDLITALSQFPGLKVIGRISSFQFRDSKEDSRSIGVKLGVTHLLEGSVRHSGEMVRVSAELIQTADGSTQWSQRYDRPYKDLFQLQDDITAAVASALKTRLLVHDKAEAQIERPPSGSLEAYNTLLQGRFYSGRATEADAHKAIELYTATTQLDPRYAQAWSELSWAWTGLGETWLGGAAAQEAYAKARAAADEALALEPNLAAAHLARAWVLLAGDFDWRRAEVESRRALELAPDYGRAKFYLADELASSGRLNQAIDLARQALATDPLHANWYAGVGGYLLGANRLDEAQAAVRKAIELQPSAQGYAPILVLIAIQRGDPQAAVAAAEREPPGVSRDFALALAHQSAGDHAAAAAFVEKYADEQSYEAAEIYALRKDPDRMFDWLERAWGNRDSGILSLLYDPLILRYKDDPRFAAFCRKVGLPVPAQT